jgi:serine/threonine-protein kinase
MKGTWCNGSPGLVFLFTQAHRTFGEARWLELAELCAWTAWDTPSRAPHLCCGSAGRAYALLSYYKQTGAREWLGRARALANRAVEQCAVNSEGDTLWRGTLGVAVLISDLASPEHARMPFFE